MIADRQTDGQRSRVNAVNHLVSEHSSNLAERRHLNAVFVQLTTHVTDLLLCHRHTHMHRITDRHIHTHTDNNTCGVQVKTVKLLSRKHCTQH